MNLHTVILVDFHFVRWILSDIMQFEQANGFFRCNDRKPISEFIVLEFQPSYPSILYKFIYKWKCSFDENKINFKQISKNKWQVSYFWTSLWKIAFKENVEHLFLIELYFCWMLIRKWFWHCICIDVHLQENDILNSIATSSFYVYSDNICINKGLKFNAKSVKQSHLYLANLKCIASCNEFALKCFDFNSIYLRLYFTKVIRCIEIFYLSWMMAEKLTLLQIAVCNGNKRCKTCSSLFQIEYKM